MDRAVKEPEKYFGWTGKKEKFGLESSPITKKNQSMHKSNCKWRYPEIGNPPYKNDGITSKPIKQRIIQGPSI